MPKIRLPFAFIVVAIAVLALPLVASASNSWSNYHWARTANPLPLSLGDNVSSSWDDFLTTANSDWNVSEVLNNSVDPGRTNPRKCGPDDGLVEICNAKYGSNGWLGVAGIWVSAGHITKGYVKVNDSYFNLDTYNTPAWRQMVMCQEIGHIFGLDHQDEEFDNPNLGTCMDYTSDPEGPPSNENPNDHDYDQLAAIYGHLDGFDSWAPPPVDDGGKGNGKGNGKGKKDEPPGQSVREWGKAISTDGKGRPDLFERDLGNGDKVLTHVLWAN